MPSSNLICDQMLGELEEVASSLTSWELNFVDDLQREAGLYTTSQKEKVREIWEARCG